jgi:Ca2+-binding RTX toxin-like protein
VSNWVQVEYWGASNVQAELSRTVVTAGDGVDSVSSSVSHALTYGVENLTLTGAGDVNGTGNAANNVITGNAANNVLDGGAGADTMAGGAGNDTYVVDNAGDTVTENANEGTDLVQSSASFTLSANLENLTLTGSGNVNGTGNSLNNVITGNSGNNVLDGGAGADTLDRRHGQRHLCRGRLRHDRGERRRGYRTRSRSASVTRSVQPWRT